MYFEDVHDAVVVDPQAFGEHIIGELFCPAGLLPINKDDNFLFRESALKRVCSHTRLHMGVSLVFSLGWSFAVSHIPPTRAATLTSHGAKARKTGCNTDSGAQKSSQYLF